MVTEKPDPILIKRFAAGAATSILPSKYIKEKGEEHFLRQPVGTGAFKFIEWIRNDRHYWGISKKVKDFQARGDENFYLNRVSVEK